MMVHPSPQGKGIFSESSSSHRWEVALGAEHLVEMAEAGQGRHQLYPLSAQYRSSSSISAAVSGVSSRQISPEITEQEGVLQYTAEAGSFYNTPFYRPFFQEGQLWHPSSGNVRVKPSVGDVRLVLNGNGGGSTAPALRRHLQQGLAAVPYAGLPACNTHVFHPLCEPVALRRHLLRLRQQNNIARAARPWSAQGKAQLLLQRLHSQLCLGGQLFRRRTAPAPHSFHGTA